MDYLNYYLNITDKERNIYEPAELIEQNRLSVNEYRNLLQNPIDGNEIDEDYLLANTQNDVVGFIQNTKHSNEWNLLNKQFLNYHKSLSLYTLINSVPINNYIALHSGIGFLKNLKVADIGGGTGHAFCSFFQYPETIEYYLIDPNLRLLHDQFIRIFPKLSYLKMGHILAKAEQIPFKEEVFDLTMSLSAIDHMEDFKKFISEANRITKKGGLVFISSHFDFPESPEDATKFSAKIFSNTLWERIVRFLYYRKFKVKSDDHTFHFSNTEPIINELKNNGLTIEKEHCFKRYFYIIARKS